MTCDGEPGSIAAARHFAAAFLAGVSDEHGMPVTERTTGTVQLIVSELVTNAVKYAPGPCHMDLKQYGGILEITLRDNGPALPVARAAAPDRIGQHGLEIVLALCEDFDVRRESAGKRVRVRVCIGPAAGGDTRRSDQRSTTV